MLHRTWVLFILFTCFAATDAVGQTAASDETTSGSAQFNVGDTATIPLSDDVGMTFVWIPGGSFVMGSPEGEPGRDPTDEGPRTQVELTEGFWLSQTEVTQAQWKAVMGTDPAGDYLEGSYGVGPDVPVYRVSWNEAMEFCSRLAEKTGLNVTLPTEAQWEFACRAGTSTAFSFGDSALMDEFAWHSANTTEMKAQRVKTKKPNPWGLYDMHGNVAEWCRDWYVPELPGGEVIDPTGPEEGKFRSMRGGSWYYGFELLRSAARAAYHPNGRRGTIGFRVLATE